MLSHPAILGNMGTLRLQMLFLLSLLVPPLACHRSPDPDARAAELLEKSQGDDEWAQNFWKKEPKNWDRGLRATVAWKEPGSTATVETIRDIRTEDLLGCLPKRFSRSVYFHTAVSVAGSEEHPFAVFSLARSRRRTAVQKQVQAAVAAAHGDEPSKWA
jgi:hypothetical protein